MAKENPVGGGIAYYGHSTDADADFRAAMTLLAGTGHISTTYTETGINIKYDWMATGKWIANLTNVYGSETYTGYAYSVYASESGDIFCVFDARNTPFTNPKYVGESGETWTGSTTGGSSETTTRMTLAKLKSEDVMGSGESYEWWFTNGYYWYAFPDNISSPMSGSSASTNANANLSGGWKFTVLGPIIGTWCTGVPTYARRVYATDTGIPTGAYTIAGYNFRCVLNQSDDRYYYPILLRNGEST